VNYKKDFLSSPTRVTSPASLKHPRAGQRQL
jgi:hypothetical protein